MTNLTMVRHAAVALLCMLVFDGASQTAQQFAPARENDSKRRASSSSTKRNGSSAVSRDSATSRAGEPKSAPRAQGNTHSTTGTVMSVQQTSDSRVGISLSIAAAQRWYEFRSGTLAWRDPLPSETNHVTVSVEDTSDHRFITGCKVTASASDATGEEVFSTTTLTMLWHPDRYTYGANVSVPENKNDLTIYVAAEPPDFGRAEKENGAFFTETLKSTFVKVHITDRTTSAARAEAAQPEHASFPEGRHEPVTPTPYPGSTQR